MGNANAMPPDVGQVFNEVWKEFFRLNGMWTMCRRLSASQEDVGLMNECAPVFFGRCQAALQHDVVMGICRLCDRATQGGYKNMSLQRLCQLACPHMSMSPESQCRLEKQLDKVLELSKPFQKVRNKRLAHADFDKAVSGFGSFYEGITDERVDDEREAIRGILLIVSGHFSGPAVCFPSWAYHAQQVIGVLKRAKAYESANP